MFAAQLVALRFAAISVARRAKWGAIGGFFLLLAVIFLGVAIWVVLANAVGVVATALILCVLCLLIGLGALAFSRYPPRVIPRPMAPHVQAPLHGPVLNTGSIINAVVMGIAAGRAMRRRDR